MSFDAPRLPMAPAVQNPALHLWCEEMREKMTFYLLALQAQVVALQAASALAYQPLDTELTAIAGLVSAADKMPYFTGSGTAALADLTSAGRALIDDANAAAQRTTLGLGAAALLADPVPVVNGGTGSATASAARTALGAANTTFTVAQFWFGIRPLTGAAGTLAAADGSLVDATDMDGFVAGRNMADAARTDHAFTWTVPDELDTTQVVTATAYYRIAAAGTGAAVEVQTTLRIVGDDALLLSGGTQIDTAAVKDVNSYSAGDLVVHSLGTVIGVNKLAVNNIVKGTVFRDAQAGNADDTFANTINMICLKFVGTRKTA